MIRITALMTAAVTGGLLLCFSFAQDRQETQRDSIAPKKEPAPPATIGHPAFMSPHASPIALSGGRVYVTNTPADTVDVIDAKTYQIVVRINVGVNPVGIAVRPDGKEVWVANHISDSVSVIDIDPASTTCFQVTATIQDFDPATKATRFDEPVGVAFATNEKAYVSLSSENKIAVVDVATRQIQKRLDIAAQDPRAMVVRDGRLYILPFESNNQRQDRWQSRNIRFLESFDRQQQCVVVGARRRHRQASESPGSRLVRVRYPNRHTHQDGQHARYAVVWPDGRFEGPRLHCSD